MGQLVRAVAAARNARTLFKTLSNVEVTFNPFDPQATIARYLSPHGPDGTRRILALRITANA
jgi:hypothetical protein